MGPGTVTVVKLARLAFLLIILSIIFFKANFFSMLLGDGDFWDLRNYLHTIDDLKQGVSPYDVSYMQTLGPPLVLVPYLLLNLVPIKAALILFTISSLGAGVVSCWLLVKKYWPDSFQIEKTLLLAIFLFSAFPTRFNFITGQSGLWGMLMITALLATKSEKIKGTWLGLLIVLKTFFAFSLLVQINRLPSLKWAFFTIMAMFLLSLVLIKPGHYTQYWTRFSGVMWQPDRIQNLAYYNQSLRTSLSRLRMIDASVPIWIVVSLISAIYAIFSGNLPAALVLSIILSPVAWQHYFVMIFPLFILTFEQIRRNWKWLLVWLASFYFWWTEFPWLHNQPASWWSGILASHYIISGLLLLSILMYNHHRQ